MSYPTDGSKHRRSKVPSYYYAPSVDAEHDSDPTLDADQIPRYLEGNLPDYETDYTSEPGPKPLPPVWGTIPDITTDTGVAIPPHDTSAFVTPPEGETIVSYSATGLPASLVIDPATGIITGTVDADGTYTVTVTATASGGGSASTTFTITATTPVTTTPAPTTPPPTTTPAPTTPPPTTTPAPSGNLTCFNWVANSNGYCSQAFRDVYGAGSVGGSLTPNNFPPAGAAVPITCLDFDPDFNGRLSMWAQVGTPFSVGTSVVVDGVTYTMPAVVNSAPDTAAGNFEQVELDTSTWTPTFDSTPFADGNNFQIDMTVNVVTT